MDRRALPSLLRLRLRKSSDSDSEKGLLPRVQEKVSDCSRDGYHRSASQISSTDHVSLI